MLDETLVATTLATLQAKRRFESLLAPNLVDGLLDVFYENCALAAHAGICAGGGQQ